MKKHISDPAPRFIELGLTIAPEIEAAVLHTLQKEKELRTPTVEALISELNEAIYPQSIGIHTTSGRSSLPSSTLSVHTRPPQSSVFIDNISVGQSRDDGWLMLEGIQSGNHHLRVIHDGFQDWFGDVVCDGKPAQIVAELRSQADDATERIVPPATESVHSLAETQLSHSGMRRTQMPGATATARQGVAVPVPAPKPKRGLFSPLVLGILGLLLLLVLGVAGITGAYMLGLFPKIGGGANNSVNRTVSPSPAATTTATTSPNVPPAKAELISIPGGAFTMGRNDGNENERPAHQVTVKDFGMDKTEVTNGEFLDFIHSSGYKPAAGEKFLAHWVNDKPIAGEENMPVRFVNIDDIKAFAAWRSKRDGVTYRLPTEQEWEYAARNGSKQNMYPWGDRFDAKCAVIDQTANDPVAVGTKSCANSWGVQDLIGNVFEWTGSEASLYPGSTGEILPRKEPYMMARGGSAFQKSSGPNAITATFRIDVPASRRSPELGFRLVRVQSTATAN